MVQLERDFHYWRAAWLSFHQPVTRRRRREKRNDHVNNEMRMCRCIIGRKNLVCFSSFIFLLRSLRQSDSFVVDSKARAHSRLLSHRQREGERHAKRRRRKKNFFFSRDESRLHRVGQKQKKKEGKKHIDEGKKGMIDYSKDLLQMNVKSVEKKNLRS